MRILNISRLIVISFLLLLLSVAVTMYIKRNSSTNVPKSATLVFNVIGESYE